MSRDTPRFAPGDRVLIEDPKHPGHPIKCVIEDATVWVGFGPAYRVKAEKGGHIGNFPESALIPFIGGGVVNDE